MEKIYVSKDSLKESIQYFCNNEYNSPEQIGLFLYFKAIGFNSREYSKYLKTGSLEAEKKLELTKIIYNLSGLFNLRSENGQNRTALFPFSIKHTIGKKTYYNGGTKFRGILARISDTIDNTLIDENKYLRKDELDSESYKFTAHYIDQIFKDFLIGNPISLSRLAAWCFRFYEFEVEDNWSQNETTNLYEDFTRMCVKKLIDELNLTQEELEKLFVKDDFLIRYQSEEIEGTDVRGLLNFESGDEPEIIDNNTGMNYMEKENEIKWTEIKTLVIPHGKNITEEKLEGLLIDTKQVVLTGPPGTGKTYISSIVQSKFDNSILIQFHPNLTYEQFIGGSTFDENGQVRSKAGVFVEFCEEAKRTPEQKYLFLIDEINRGNVSKIFGEVILTLDRGYEAVLPTELKLSNGSSVTSFKIPNNVYILATMNSSDRSIAIVDYAIRRRFAFVTFYPNYEVVDYNSDYSKLSTISASKLMAGINKRIMNILNDPDLLLGQSYFMPKWIIEETSGKYEWTDENLRDLFYYYLLPIIEEYTYGNKRYLLNILGDKLVSGIDDAAEFGSEIAKQFG